MPAPLSSIPDDGIRIVRPDWTVSPRIRTFTTTRLGGVSQPPFDSLNLGLHVGDVREAVQHNRQRLQVAAALPAPPCWLQQTHGSEILRILGEHEQSDERRAADGAWTDQPGCVLAVLTADCLPVVVARSDGREVAVVHAGWRGLAEGILEKALAIFDSSAELQAWLGPAIGPRAFEVGEEVRERFIDRHRTNAACFQPGRVLGLASSNARRHYFADIYALARKAMQRCRPITIVGGEYCTVRQTQWFHSYRRDGVSSGRMVTLAWIDSSLVVRQRDNLGFRTPQPSL